MVSSTKHSEMTRSDMGEVDYDDSIDESGANVGQGEGSKGENVILRRNRPGTSAKHWCQWGDQELDEMESTLAVQQYIQQLIRKDASQVESILSAPDQQDESIWKYEQVREFCLELNSITVRLQHECNPATCTQMTATEQWIFLCAAHKNPKECSAIDYTRHTLDGAACLLNSNRYFPSRVNIKESSVQKLGSICRRIYRIFSHAYFHHRPIYDEFERETSLCKRFTKFVTKYDLMTSETLIVPIDAEEDPLSSTTTTSTTTSTTSTLPAQTIDSSSTTNTVSTVVEAGEQQQPHSTDGDEEGSPKKSSEESDA